MPKPNRVFKNRERAPRKPRATAQRPPRRRPYPVAARVYRWGPPAVWTAFIFWFSTESFSAGQTGSLFEPFLHWLFPSLSPAHVARAHHWVRKGAHVTVYGILALLVFRALGDGRGRRGAVRRAGAALAAVGACALVDEWHQSLTRTRTGSLRDSLIDLAGGSLALVLALAWSRGTPGAARHPP